MAKVAVRTVLTTFIDNQCKVVFPIRLNEVISNGFRTLKDTLDTYTPQKESLLLKIAALTRGPPVSSSKPDARKIVRVGSNPVEKRDSKAILKNDPISDK